MHWSITSTREGTQAAKGKFLCLLRLYTHLPLNTPNHQGQNCNVMASTGLPEIHTPAYCDFIITLGIVSAKHTSYIGNRGGSLPHLHMMGQLGLICSFATTGS
ncbi:hypothetical protein XENTR_v10007113 [Xenopus tropicalis]|nr:hypothetical protein XENTR_v10007113 [Xenopus tropicalis]